MPKGTPPNKQSGDANPSPPSAPNPSGGVTLGGPKSQQPKNQQPKNQQPKNQQPKNQQPKNQQPKNQQPKNQQPKAQQPKNQQAKNPAEVKKEKAPEKSDVISIETPGVKQNTKHVDFSSPKSFEFGSFKDALLATGDSLISSLPPVVQTRIKALQKLQHSHSEYEKEFVKEMRILEAKYEGLYAPLYDKRTKIVTGEYEPVKDDLKTEDQESFVALSETDVKGIPEFWLTVLQKNEVLNEMITDKDVEALKHLTDIKYINSDLKLRLEFTFTENEFFTDSLLVKTYLFEEDPETNEESGSKIEGTQINWKQGKDLTEKIVKKKIKQKGKVKVVNKREPCDSFFNFFNPKNVPEGLEEDDLNSEDGELVQLVEQDFEIGNMFKETIIPNAVKWFTGELSMDDDDEEHDFDEDDEEEEEEEDDEDEDDEDDAPRSKKGHSHGHSHGHGHGHSHGHSHGAKPAKQTPPTQPTNPEQPPECKQQ